MNGPVDDVLGRDAAVLRVRGALAFTDLISGTACRYRKSWLFGGRFTKF
jgi:hypothetical protein